MSDSSGSSLKSSLAHVRGKRTHASGASEQKWNDYACNNVVRNNALEECFATLLEPHFSRDASFSTDETVQE